MKKIEIMVDLGITIEVETNASDVECRNLCDEWLSLSDVQDIGIDDVFHQHGYDCVVIDGDYF